MLATTRRTASYACSVAAKANRARRPGVVVQIWLKQYSTATDLPVPNKTKVWDSVDEAVKDIKSGDVLLSAGKRYNQSNECDEMD